MSDSLTPQQFTRIALAAFLAFAAVVAVIHSRQDKRVGVIAPVKQEQKDATSSKLARCRTITPDESVALDNCRRAWASNRKHFFAPGKSTQPHAPPTSTAGGPGKSQDRVTPVEAKSEAR